MLLLLLRMPLLLKLTLPPLKLMLQALLPLPPLPRHCTRKVVPYGPVLLDPTHSKCHSMSENPISRKVLPTSVIMFMLVNIGMDQREEESLENTEELWTNAIFLELVNAPSMLSAKNTQTVNQQQYEQIKK